MILALRAGGRRRIVTVLGVLVVGAMAGAAVSVAVALDGGFDRSARQADLPDVVARFAPQPRARMSALISALPNVQSFVLRPSIDGVDLSTARDSSRRGSLQVVGTGRKGYDVVAGRDLRGDESGVLIERGLATEWKLSPGDDLDVGRAGELPVRGVVVAPDNVAFPLASAPRVYISAGWLRERIGFDPAVSAALVWTHDPARTDITLQQARATASQVKDLRFVTRAGVRSLIDQAAGIVIGLLVAFSLVALAAAATLLASQAAAEVQRRARSLGVLLALGQTRRRVAAEQAGAAALIALGAGGLGIAIGALLVRVPAARLLSTLNEQPPGWAIVPWLVALAAVLTAIAATAAWVPAWRATARVPAALLRGGDLPARTGRRRRGRFWVRQTARDAAPRTQNARPGRFVALGARMALARRGRALATVLALATSAAVVLLMLGLASLVVALRDDPGSVGKRYQLTARLPDTALSAVRNIPGVAAASHRYVVQGADSYALGETVKLLGFPGDHTRFEDPPLAEGHRVTGPGQVEIGDGLSTALGVGVGGRLAVALPNGRQAQFTVVGIVRALDSDGRVGYVRPDRLLAADPDLTPETVIALKPGADKAAVSRRLSLLGAQPGSVGGATTRSGAFLDVLAAVLRVIAALNVLVCLYALAQALGLTARERRPALALLRAQGAGRRVVLAVLAGAALALALPSAALAVALEQLVLAPLVAGLAVGYADLSAGATTGQSLAVAAGLAALALLAAGGVARGVLREPPVDGLKEQA